MNEKKIEPFDYAEWSDLDVLVLTYQDVTFTENIGPFTVGEKFECVTLDLQKCLLQAVDEDGGEIKSCYVKLVERT